MSSVYPSYDGADAHEWKYGVQAHSNEAGGNRYANDSEAQWIVGLNKIALEPGTYSITNFRFMSRSLDGTNCSELYLVVYTGSVGGNLTKLSELDIYAHGDLDLGGGAGGTQQSLTLSPAFDLTIVEGTEYWLGLAFRCPLGRAANTPVIRTCYNLVLDGQELSGFWQPADQSGVPSSVDANPLLNDWYMQYGITFETAVARPYVHDSTPVDTGGVVHVLPYRTDAPYHILFRDAEVADASSIAGDLYEFSAGDSQIADCDIDLGATDQITFGQNGATENVALGAREWARMLDFCMSWWSADSKTYANLFYIDRTTGQGAQTDTSAGTTTGDALSYNAGEDTTEIVTAADTFTVNYVGGTLKFDVSQNVYDIVTYTDVRTIDLRGDASGEGVSKAVTATMMVDYMTRSHAAAASGGSFGVRGAKHTIDAGGTYTCPEYMVLTAGGANDTIESVQVAARLAVYLGDSQVSRDAPNRLYRLSTAIDGALGETIPWWQAAIPGNKLTLDTSGYHTAAYQRFCNDTPGDGDLCDMPSILLAYCGLGGGDIASVVGSDEDARNPLIAEMVQRVAGILSLLFANANALDNRAFLLGSGPLTQLTAIEQLAVSQFNDALAGLAKSVRVPFFNPFNLVQANIATYLVSGGVTDHHYTTTGATAVGTRAAAMYENNRIVPLHDGKVFGL